MTNLQCSRNTTLPGNVCTYNVSSLLVNHLGYTPMTATCGFCSCNGNVQCFAELTILIQFKVAEGFFQPDIVQTLQLATHTNSFVKRVFCYRVTHQSEVISYGLSQILMNAHIRLYRSTGMNLITLDASLLIIERLVNVFLFRVVEKSTGIDGQLLSISSQILIERQSGSLGADVPQCYINRSRQINGEERQMTVNVPQLMPYLLMVIR